MIKNNSIRKTVSFVFWVVLIIVAIYLPKLLDYKWWSVLVGALPFIVRLAYDHFDWINLFINRSLLWITNSSVAWEMKARYQGDFSEVDINEIIKILRTKETSLKLVQSESLEKTISLPNLGMVIKVYIGEVRQDENDFTSEIVFAVQRVYIPFQHSTMALNKLISLIDQVRRSINFGTEHYDFKAVFTEANPYLGLFLRRLKLAESSNINVDYRETEGANKAKVTVTKNKVSLITTDLHSLQSFSKKYITLSSLNLSES